MSEYWKSQPRKFCEFCKCWITDNKPSVDFHEKGKKHQENVKLKIEEAKKKGSLNEKKKQKENEYLARMEKAAMEAFKKDLEDNPELAKQYNINVPEVVEGPSLPPEGYIPEAEEEKKDEEGKDEGKKEEWYEAQSEMGYPYYWNTATGESIWVAPEKYVSLEEQGLPPAPKLDDTAPQSTSQQDTKPEVKPADIPLPSSVESIPLPGELPAPEQPPEESEEEEEEEEEVERQDRNARGVYGSWARVQKVEEKYVDLQLPKTEVVETISIPVPKEEVKVRFKEKKVSSLGSKGPVAFKKRKLGDGARNVRRRNDDDD